MKNKKVLFLIFIFIGIFLFQHDLVNAAKFHARFFPGQGGYLKYSGSSQYMGSKDIDTDVATTLDNHYVRDDCSFYGWVAERDNGAVWYCKEDMEGENCGSENNYSIYSSTNKKKYQTGNDGGNAGYHAVWQCGNDIIYPEELGQTYSYYDVQYNKEDEIGYLGGQSVIIGNDNKLMNYEIADFNGWNVFIASTDWRGLPENKWYCGEGKELSTNCRTKYVAYNYTKEAGNNGDLVVYVATVKDYKPKYNILYLLSDDNEINLNSNCIGNAGCIYEEVPYDTDVKLNVNIFQKEGKIIGGWYVYIYRVDDGKYQCYNKNRKLAGQNLFSSPEDYKVKFDSEFCDKPIKVGKNDKINIPYDSDFTRQDFRWSLNPSIVGNDNFVLYAQAIWVDGEQEQPTGYTDEDICKENGNIWIKKSDKGYCSIDGLLYLKCGDIYGFPEIVPKISSYFVTLLKTVAPIVLIIVSVISLVKAISAGKEEDIKKAQTTLVKKIIIGGIIFFVVTIVQFIMLKVADSSEKDNLSKCLSCFLNGTDDDNCDSISYKTRNDNGEVVFKNISK